MDSSTKDTCVSPCELMESVTNLSKSSKTPLILSLKEDELMNVLSFLEWSHLVSLGCVNKRCMQLVFDDPNSKLWKLIIANYSIGLYDKLREKHETSATDLSVACLLQSASKLDVLEWSHCKYAQGEINPVASQEAHAGCKILERFLCIVGGWGPESFNGISILDGRSLTASSLNNPTLIDPKKCPEPADAMHYARCNSLTLRTVPVRNVQVGRFRYGMTVVAVPPSPSPAAPSRWRLLIFGGLTVGGYGGDCNDLYHCDLEFQSRVPDSSDFVEMFDDEALFTAPNNSLFITAHHKHVVPTARPPLESTIAYNTTQQRSASIPTTRGYHTANLVQLGDRKCMLVFGGLHERSPTSKLEVYDLASNTWLKPEVNGTEPSRRFGHTSVVTYPNTHLKATQENILRRSCQHDHSKINVIIAGGSDGSDLIRNGRELRTIHVLTIENDVKGNTYTLNWSVPLLTSAIEGTQLIPGRCHSANLVGDQIVYFGGSAKMTTLVSVLNMNPSKQADPSWIEVPFSPQIGSRSTDHFHLHHPIIDRHGYMRFDARPKKRLSHVSWAIGPYIVIHGGFSKKFRELGDLWVLHLAHGTSQRIRPLSDRRYDEVEEMKYAYAAWEWSSREEAEWLLDDDGDDDDAREEENDGPPEWHDSVAGLGEQELGLGEQAIFDHLLQQGVSPQLINLLMSGMINGQYEGEDDEDEDEIYEGQDNNDDEDDDEDEIYEGQDNNDDEDDDEDEDDEEEEDDAEEEDEDIEDAEEN